MLFARAGYLRLVEWMDAVKPKRDEFGVLYKWVNGVRYRKPQNNAHEEWPQAPLVNTNPFPNEVLVHIYAELPMYWVITTCSLVCKNWHRSVQRVPTPLWRKKIFAEWEIGPRDIGPRTPLVFIRRRCRAVQLLKMTLESEHRRETWDFVSSLIWKGLPFLPMDGFYEKVTKLVIEDWKRKEMTNRPSVHGKNWWGNGQIISHNLGPFSEDEFAPGKSDQKTWRRYVRMLLIISGYENLYLDRGANSWMRSENSTAQSRSEFVTTLHHFLQKEVQHHIIVSNRVMMDIDEDNAFDLWVKHKNILQRFKDEEIQKLARANSITRAVPIQRGPTVRNISFDFYIGDCVNVDSLHQNGPWYSEYHHHNNFIVVVYPIPGPDKGKRAELRVSPGGFVSVEHCSDPAMIQKIHDDFMVMVQPFLIRTGIEPGAPTKRRKENPKLE